MTTASTTLLGLALPVTGELTGTWGDVVNASLTNLLDTAIAGTTTLSSDADVTLSTTTLAANQARQSIILWTAGGTATRTITAPAQSKSYVVINATTSSQSIKLVGAGPTAGITVIAGEKCLAAWNGSDFVKLSTFSGAATFSSVTDSGLTSTRVTYAGASGLLQDSANLTFSGTVLGVTGTIAITGALTATLDSTFSSTGALLISKGTTAQQPTPTTGMLRYNTTTSQFEGYSGSSPAWNPVGGASVSNDTSTASNLYPLFASATSGTATTVYTSNAKLLYKPSTGELAATTLNSLNGLFVNSQTVSVSCTVATGNSASSVGPITISGGVAVTLNGTARWVVS